MSMSGLYSRKFTLDELIKYHERRVSMCEHQSDRADEAEFHYEAVMFLKKVKEKNGT